MHNLASFILIRQKIEKIQIFFKSGGGARFVANLQHCQESVQDYAIIWYNEMMQICNTGNFAHKYKIILNMDQKDFTIEHLKEYIHKTG